MADDLVTARTALQQEIADESILLERRRQVEAAIAAAREAEAALEAALREDLPALSAGPGDLVRAVRLRERLRGTQSLAAERVRNAAGTPTAEPGESRRDPDQLEAEAERVREQEQCHRRRGRGPPHALEQAGPPRKAPRTPPAEEDAGSPGCSAPPPTAARGWPGCTARSTRSAPAPPPPTRDRAADPGPPGGRRPRRARPARLHALETRVAGLDAGEEGLDAEHEAAEARLLDDIEDRLAKARDEAQQADRDRSALAGPQGRPRDGPQPQGRRRRPARRLRLGLRAARLGGRAALGADRLRGRRRRCARLGRRRRRRRRPRRRRRRHRHLKATTSAARACCSAAGLADTDWPGLPATRRTPWTSWTPADALRPGAARLLFKVAVVDDLAAARRLVAELPDVTAVTREGDVLGAHFARRLVQPAEPDRDPGRRRRGLPPQLAEAIAASSGSASTSPGSRPSAWRPRSAPTSRWPRLHESDATLAAVAEELGQYGSQAAPPAARPSGSPGDRHRRGGRDQDLAGLAEPGAALARPRTPPRRSPTPPSASGWPKPPGPPGRARWTPAWRCAPPRSGPARCTAAPTRWCARPGRARGPRPGRRAPRAPDPRGPRRRGGRRRRRPRARRSRSRSHRAAEARTAVEQARQARAGAARDVRARLRDLGREHDELVNSVHRDEMARTQQRMRIEQLEERALEELGLDPDGLVADYGPDQPRPATGTLTEAGRGPEPDPYVREEQQKRLRAPSGRWPCSAGSTRSRSRSSRDGGAAQVPHRAARGPQEDPPGPPRHRPGGRPAGWSRSSPRPADVSKAFDSTFARLFPGGEGRLVLTDPDDMLTTGIEVEARPPARRSSGSRCSPVASGRWSRWPSWSPCSRPPVAVLHPRRGRGGPRRHQPRPAAGDLRGAPRELQLLVITHQKRTMEVGDALYGVTMRGDGVSAVISQRLRGRTGVICGRSLRWAR